MLDVALVIGVLLSILNLGDMLLRQHQKQAFQAATETVVLWLDYQRPLKLLARLPDVRRWQLVLLSVCGIGFSTLGISLGGRVVAILSLLLLFQSCLIVGAIPVWHRCAEIVRLVGVENGPATFALRAVGVVAGTFGAQIVLSLLYNAIPPLAIFGFIVTIILVVTKARWFFIFNAAAPICVVALVASAVLLAAHTIVQILRMVGWRVVEYSKGAWSAIILIGTAALGIVRLVYR